jgi:hypothetical protein
MDKLGSRCLIVPNVLIVVDAPFYSSIPNLYIPFLVLNLLTALVLFQVF